MANTPKTPLSTRLSHLSTKLHPLISLSTGIPHPSFPLTLLQYHLLSATQLDDLASYYHQRSPSAYSMQYPLPIVTRWKQPPSTLFRDQTFLRTQLERSFAPEEADELEQRIINLARSDVNITPSAPEQMDAEILATEHKRRRFGRFIGLRGCETPGPQENEGEMREEMEAWIREELARKRRRDEEAERMREKSWGRRGGMF